MSGSEPRSEHRPEHRPEHRGGLRPAWKPGQSGNPAGRPKGIEARARAYTEQAIETLVRELNNPRNCVPAAVALLDRGWGKPKQMLQGDRENPIQFVIRGPSPVESASDWLRHHAPPMIDADETTEG